MSPIGWVAIVLGVILLLFALGSLVLSIAPARNVGAESRAYKTAASQGGIFGGLFSGSFGQVYANA